ncbi:MAG: hypothetical protein ACK5L3_13695 [Oscillospiraceae bacterium]
MLNFFINCLLLLGATAALALATVIVYGVAKALRGNGNIKIQPGTVICIQEIEHPEVMRECTVLSVKQNGDFQTDAKIPFYTNGKSYTGAWRVFETL